MLFRKKAAALLAAALTLGVTEADAQSADFHVVPLPKEVKAAKNGNFVLNPYTAIVYPKGEAQMKRNAELLVEYIKESTGLKLTLLTQAPPANAIVLSDRLKHDNAEAYTLRVNDGLVLIDGASAAGAFYGVQTLRKALPVVRGDIKGITLPGTDITDWPRFAYRGAHLDVSRHFVGVDSVRRFIDMLALHNINRLHWHLTDDQGWRIEIKKYPLLTKVGSRRAQTVIGHNSGKYDGKPYGGFYTQKEIKEIVRYAAERHITVIPEIDLPGHMQAALSAYPELGCTGGPYKVWEQWGVSDNVLCAGNDKVFTFIDDVLAEVAKLFPSQYIHVGGDECPKTQWKKCPKCQARIKAEHLEADGKHTAEERLQSYVIRHAEKTLSALGRRMIGWDETLEGGLAPGATVMSWRGESGGIEAARQKHDVIMSPNTYLYFDYYQTDDTASEPDAIGGYLPIERVYSYEPMPEGLSAAEQKYIVGVQANCWTEYMPTYRQIEYMELPRMAALSETQWCAAGQKDFSQFMQRLQRLTPVYDNKGYNYCRVIYNVVPAYSQDTVRHATLAKLTTFGKAAIHYTLDGSGPTAASPRYTEPIVIDKDCRLRAAAFRPSGRTPEVGQDFKFHKAACCPVKLLQPTNSSYTYTGPSLLVDGLYGDMNSRTGRWMGFNDSDLDAVVDFGKPTAFSSVTVRAYVDSSDWIFAPRGFEVLSSEDGKTFASLAAESYPPMEKDDPREIKTYTLTFPAATARYIRVKMLSEHSMPLWHGTNGKPGFLFVDEIEVR